MKTRNSKTKAFAFFGAAFVLLIAMLFTACPNAAGGGGGGGSGSGGGGGGTPDVGSFEDAGDGFIKIIPPINGITGVEPAYTLPGTGDNYKGVFIAGRTVKLSPYKLGKTEVTYELWYSVLKWNREHHNRYTFANKGKDTEINFVIFF